MAASKHALGQAALLDRLLCALEGAAEAFSTDIEADRDAALAEGMAVLGELYGSLDPTTSPEASAHLGTACDVCFVALGDAYAGSPEALAAATSFVRSIRVALVPGSRFAA
jgi:hypothetical protein